MLYGPASPAQYDAIVLLWALNTCVNPGLCCGGPCIVCQEGSQRFLCHLTVMSRRQPASIVMIDALLDIMMGSIRQASLADRSGRIVCSQVVMPLLYLLQSQALESQRYLLHRLNSIIIGNSFNCRQISSQFGWQFPIYHGMTVTASLSDGFTSIEVADEIVLLSMNLLVVPCFDALMQKRDFISLVGQTLARGSADERWQ